MCLFGCVFENFGSGVITTSDGVDCFLIGEYNIHTLRTPYEHKHLFLVSFTIGN